MSDRPTRHIIKQDAAVKVLRVMARQAKAEKRSQVADAFYFAAEIVKYSGFSWAPHIMMVARRARASTAWHEAMDEAITITQRMSRE